MMKTLLSSVFSRLIRQGELCVQWPDTTCTRFGRPGGAQAAVKFADWGTVRRLALNPGLAFGEAYMDGTLQPAGCTLYELLDLIMLNVAAGTRHPVMRWQQSLHRLTRAVRQVNNPRRARQHVAHHYDLDSRLYSLFLDSDRQYSCAYFESGNESLEEAQRAKKRLIATKLYLIRPDLTVLDIGCGWGGLALTLAAEYGARVTGITLSVEQLQHARARAQLAGLADRVQFELADYRDIRRRFDRVVSVGMMEHVGVVNYGGFFSTVHQCLVEDGVALIHHIGRSDGPGSTAAWLQKYIFPGGYSPALSEVVPAVERSGLVITDIETWRLHYARTLQHWRARFAENRGLIRQLYDERFCRMFEFYLVAAELAFRHDREVVFQIQASRSQTALPFTRDYLLRTQPAALAPPEHVLAS